MKDKICDKKLERLVDTAIEAGATAANLIKVKDIVLDPRTYLKCQIPLCPSYNQNKMCPPIITQGKSWPDLINRYHIAIFIQKKFTAKEDAKYKGKALSELYQEASFLEKRQSDCLILYHILECAERKALEEGFLFTVGLGEGPCRVCLNCNLHEPCPEPFKARPSMEAIGINVYETAINANCPIKFHSEHAGEYSYNGLILVD